jgi:serine/threonine protein kinase
MMSDAAREEPSAVSPPRDARRDLSGKVLGDFRLIRKLGEGGMGQVYLAEQISLRRRVAVKLLRSDLAGQEVSLKRFRAEAKIVAQLNHPNIVQVYAFGESEGVHYMAMEYVDGRNLRDYLRRHGPAPVALVLHIVQQVALALQRASELGLVHRDIKPENILLTRRGEVKVADFGLSRMIQGEEAQRLTQTGTTLGTPLYMSPEQVEGRPLDCRSDIYSLGVTCYHLLAGRPPFEGRECVCRGLAALAARATTIAIFAA